MWKVGMQVKNVSTGQIGVILDADYSDSLPEVRIEWDAFGFHEYTYQEHYCVCDRCYFPFEIYIDSANWFEDIPRGTSDDT